MDLISATEVKQCPHCHAFELILDERSHRDNDIEWCLVCGFARDGRDGDILRREELVVDADVKALLLTKHYNP